MQWLTFTTAKHFQVNMVKWRERKRKKVLITVIPKSTPHCRPQEKKPLRLCVSPHYTPLCHICCRLKSQSSGTAPCPAKTVGSSVQTWLTMCFFVVVFARCGTESKKAVFVCSLVRFCLHGGRSWLLHTEIEVDTGVDIDIQMNLEELLSLNLEFDLIQKRDLNGSC